MRRVLVPALAALLVMGAATPASAGLPSLGGTAKEGFFELDGKQETPEASPVSNSQPAMVRFETPMCAGNDPVAGVNEMCVEAGEACPDDATLFRAFRAPAGTTLGQPGWEPFGLPYCTTAPAVAEPLPMLSLEDFRRLPLPAGGAQVEPPGRYVLVNMPTNVFATTTEPTVLSTTVLGVPVQVRATPERWSWDFGDGTVVGPTSDPGAPYPALTNTHAYAVRGTYDIVMTTYYSGEFSVDGATWYPIQGQAQVDSAPATVQALAGSNVLVAEP